MMEEEDVDQHRITMICNVIFSSTGSILGDEPSSDKKVIMEYPSVTYTSEYTLKGTPSGTEITRRSFDYSNNGAMPVFIDSWLMDEDTAMMVAWSDHSGDYLSGARFW